MIAIQKFEMHLDRPEKRLRVCGVQGDILSRALCFRMYQNNQPWEIPGDARAAVWYLKPDQTGGMYDTLPDGTPAWQVSGNSLTILLAPQMFTAAGNVQVQLELKCGEAVLHGFAFTLEVSRSLTLAEGSRDYFRWQNAFLPQTEGAEPGQLLQIAAVDEKGRVTKLAGTKNQGAGEPEPEDIPKVFITGAIPTTKDDVYAELEYISKTERFRAFLKIRCQGNSSMSYPKKNFTIRLYSDEARENRMKKAFRNWGRASDKFVLKANYIDHSHARNIVCANLWDQVVTSRPNYAALPREMRSSPRHGAVDGFPVKLYADGTYQGIYTWNIGKDAWMWNMDEENTNHILLCAELNTDGVYGENACNFRALWSGEEGEHWSVEVGTNSDGVRDSLNGLIACVMDTDDAAFKETIGNYLDISSAMDYWIHQYVICGLDGLAKNMLLASYDGKKWICGAYDMDATFGLWWDGTRFVSAEYRCPEDYQERYSLLWERLAKLFDREIRDRYTRLRRTVYSYANMVTQFERLADVIGKELYGEDLEVYPGIPSADSNNIRQIRDFIRDRLHYCDVRFGLIEEAVEIDYTRNPLEGLTWVDGYTYSNDTGVYVAQGGEHCTEKFSLQDCVYEGNFAAAGSYGTLFVWDALGNHIATMQGDSICFAADSGCSYAVKVYQTGEFDPTLVTLMPKDNREKMTEAVTVNLAEREWAVSGRGDIETELGLLFSGLGDEKVDVFINSVSGAVLTLAEWTKPWTVARESDTFVGALSGGAWCYLSTTMFTDVDSALAYFREHNTTITFNG